MTDGSPGEPGICVGRKGSLGDQCQRMEADKRLSPRVACRREQAADETVLQKEELVKVSKTVFRRTVEQEPVSLSLFLKETVN